MKTFQKNLRALGISVLEVQNSKRSAPNRSRSRVPGTSASLDFTQDIWDIYINNFLKLEVYVSDQNQICVALP